MQKLKFSLSVFSLVAFLLTMLSCDKETILSVTNIPTEISAYIQTHFPDNKILQATEDKDGFSKTYDIILSENIKLEFNRKKEIIEIKSKSKLPDSVIPEKIRQYTSIHFSDNFIVKWELERKYQKINLDNGLELEFTLNGDFIRIDN